MRLKKIAFVVVALSVQHAYALDVSGVVGAIAGEAGSGVAFDVEFVAIAIIGVASVIFGIKKIRQVIKA